MSLYIVATPIGNLSDITLRSLEALKEVDLILCEDTRVTQGLLSHYNIKTPTLSYHQHSRFQKIASIVQLLKENKNLALVSDAGTPGVSDPGNELIEKVIESVGDRVKIIPIPGPSAVTAAVSISGFPMDKFSFLGFPPKKRKRNKFFDEIAKSKYPVIFYESPYRIIKTLQELNFQYTKYNIQNTEIVVCRELTKKFETTYRGEITEVIKAIKNDKTKGEFVIIVNKEK